MIDLSEQRATPVDTLRAAAGRSRYPAEIIQELLELGGKILMASYAAGLKAFEGH